MVKPKLRWSRGQYEIAQAIENHRFTFVRKGRRFGATRFLGEWLTTKASDERVYILWGDTIAANIDRYVDRYILPALKDWPRKYWKWRQQKKELSILDLRVDFRGADRPDNWEGFGYHYILLNECGIILDGKKGESLYENSVLPMLSDFEESKLVGVGAPKGKNLFHSLCKEAEKQSESKVLKFTSYDNPFIHSKTIKLIESRMSPETAKQEIHAEFIDTHQGKFLKVWNRDKHIGICEPLDGTMVLSFDFNVDPMTVIVGQYGYDFLHVYDEITAIHDETTEGKGTNMHAVLCDKILSRWPGRRFIVVGDASGHKRSQHSHRNDYQAIEKYLGDALIEIEAPKRNLGLYDSRALCNAVLHTFPVLIDPDCEVLTDECGDAIWENGKIKKDRGDHKNDHLDAFRYLVHYCLGDYLEF